MDGKEELLFTDDTIRIVSPHNNKEINIVIRTAEQKLLEKQAEIVTQNGGDILEIGFGMHLSADAIQSNPNVRSHTIIEVHPEIYKLALEWAKDKKNVEILIGDWYDLLPLENKKFDGILHDTYLDENITKFLDSVKNNCKKGTVVSFFDYPHVDHRFSAYVHVFTKEELDSFPYYKPKKGDEKIGNNLYYTYFDGKKFYREKIKTKKNI